MTAIERTAYPRFKQILSAKDLAEVYTPTPQERLVAHRSTKGRVAEVGFLVLLKTYQRLGRFILLSEVPSSILDHIAKLVDPKLNGSDLHTYDTSGTRQRHVLLISSLTEAQTLCSRCTHLFSQGHGGGRKNQRGPRRPRQRRSG